MRAAESLYLERVYLKPDVEPPPGEFPGTLPLVRDLDLRFNKPVTFFVGENGSGKSTVLEAIAALSDLPVGGGGRNDAADSHSPHTVSELEPYVRAAFRKRPRDGYFFRAEFQAHFASVLDERRKDPEFRGDPYARYGGRSLHAKSHGEGFLDVFAAWLKPGLILMDEPESALSPQRQLVLLGQMAQLVRSGGVQFIVATHSPIILTFPDADILAFDGDRIARIRLQDTAHFQITKGILDAPERYWKHLLRDDRSAADEESDS